MSDGTTSKIPGWYITFQAALLMQAPRPDQIDQATAEEWSGNQGNLKKVLADVLIPPKEEKPTAPVEKFEVLVDLGVITVPDDYMINPVFCGMNFSNPSRVLKPGDKLRVEACRQIVPGTTTSKERMAYLERCEGGNVYLGAQGIELVIEQKIGQLPRDYWYGSFDREENLPEDSGGRRRVPFVSVHSDGDWNRNLGYLGNDWTDDSAFFRLSDFVESP